jgi:hypothetical protein
MNDSSDVIGMFLVIAVMAVFMYALSAAGRRWRQGFAEKPLSWLSAFSKRATAARWIVTCIGLSIILIPILTATRKHLDLRLFIVVFGITGGIANMLRELSLYADAVIEVRKRPSSRSAPTVVKR